MLASPQARVNAAYDEALRDAAAHRMSHSPGRRHHHHHHRRHHSSPRRRYHGHHHHRHGHHHRQAATVMATEHHAHHDHLQHVGGLVEHRDIHHRQFGEHGHGTACIPREYGHEQDYLEHAHRLTSAEELPQPDPRDLPPNMMQNYRQRISKMLVVPQTRQVKVPVATQKQIETTELRPTVSRHCVTDTNYEVHEEEYTQVVERKGTRFREMYIRTVVPEEYTYEEAVPLTRQIVRPVTETREVEVEEMLPQRVTKTVNVPGYRVDEIQENKLVEVDGWQEFQPVVQYMPAGFGYDHAHLAGEEGHVNRIPGHELYGPDAVRHVPADPSISPHHHHHGAPMYDGRTSPSAAVRPVSPYEGHWDGVRYTNDIYAR
eukprot:NODE_1235_length_1508_cov_43.134339_g1028_i0.p1 GENE.NODE_1235_length_1508_cov_43.134339_g1028_i0~~NODE_1235_length_1508_cov_43.134339_g1028_i0.p1  ORF type:complete len:374 (-),score=76.78 NODE_1235_length_1508_cov_43.134339_g1028_i0:157-1278(-)